MSSRLTRLADQHGLTEYAVLLSMLHASGFDTTKTAKALQLSRSQVQRLLGKHHLHIAMLSDTPSARNCRIARDALRKGVSVKDYMETGIANHGSLRAFCKYHKYSQVVAKSLLRDLALLNKAKGQWKVWIADRYFTASELIRLWGDTHKQLRQHAVQEAASRLQSTWAEVVAARLTQIGIQATAVKVTARKSRIAGDLILDTQLKGTAHS